jgi:hypothetical protein
MRDDKRGFLPLNEEPADDGRHVLSKAECRKGFEIATRRGRLPSRLQCWLRKKIRRHYSEKAEKRRRSA